MSEAGTGVAATWISRRPGLVVPTGARRHSHSMVAGGLLLMS